jgi:uncharacterized protein involved in exopolysaccharide biosynthesis
MSESRVRAEQERTVRDLLEVVFRHKIKGAIFCFLVVATALGILAFVPAEYTSTAKLMVRRGNEGLFLDSITSAGKSLPLHKEWESEINTELEILGSRELITQMIQSFGPEVFLQDPEPSRTGLLGPVRVVLSPVRGFFTRCREALARGPEEDSADGGQGAVDRAGLVVEENLLIKSREKSDIILVSYTAGSPELARQVVTRLIDIYLERRIDVHKVPGAHLFFTQQTEKLLSDLKASEEAINGIKSSAGITSLEDSRRALQTSIETIRTQRLQDESALAAANSRVETLRAILSQQANADPAAKSGALLDRTEYQALQTTLRNEEITQTVLSAGLRELDEQLVRLRRELDGINELESPIRRLEREQGLIEEKYLKYSENREQARINEELEIRKISNVSIVQQATLPAKANPSGKLIKLLAALFLGMAGGIAMTFGADCLDPALHSAADVSGRLGRTTLLELPILSSGELLFSSHRKAAGGKAKGHRREDRRRAENFFEELLFKVLALQAPGHVGPLSIGVASSRAGEGVSTIAVHLSAAFARDHRFAGTVLLDASLKEPSERPDGEMDDVPFSWQFVRAGHDDAESTGSSGAVELFAGQLMRMTKNGHAVIIVDLPPVSQGGCTMRMAAALDLVILVVEAGRVPWRTVQQAAGFLADAGANVCGIVLNRRSLAVPEWLYRKL